MNMHNFKNFNIFLLLIVIILNGCKKETIEQDYGVLDKDVTRNSVNKNRLKTEAQYISILTTDLTQKAITPTLLNRYTRVLESIGDRELATEIIVGNFMNSPDLNIPTDQVMREDIEKFIRNTYVKFYIRYPTEAEVAFFVNYINENPNVTTEMVYYSFATSAEYMFY